MASYLDNLLSGTTGPQYPTDYDDEISSAAAEYGVDEDLIRRMIQQESAWDPQAVSGAGAQGLMQLMPGTAGDLGVIDPFDPGQNISGGTRYISQMLQKYGGDQDRALAAYNWGPGNVDRLGMENAPQETRDYVARLSSGFVSSSEPLSDSEEKPMAAQGKTGSYLDNLLSENDTQLDGQINYGEGQPSYLDSLLTEGSGFDPNQPAGMAQTPKQQRRQELIQAGAMPAEAMGQYEDPDRGTAENLWHSFWTGKGIDAAEIANLATSPLGGWLGIPGFKELNDVIDNEILPALYLDRSEQFARADSPGEEFAVGASSLVGEVLGLSVFTKALPMLGKQGIKHLDSAVRKGSAEAMKRGDAPPGLSQKMTDWYRSVTRQEEKISESQERINKWAEENIANAEDVFKEGQYQDPRPRMLKVTNWMADNFTDKYSVFSSINKAAEHSIQRLRHLTGTSSAPFRQGVYEVLEDGTQNKINEPLRAIWAGESDEFINDASFSMMARRNIAASGKKGVDVSPESVASSRQLLKDMKQKYGLKRWDEMNKKIDRHGVWRHRATFNGLVETGILSQRQVDDLVKQNPGYAPLFKVGSEEPLGKPGITDQMLGDISKVLREQYTEKELASLLGNDDLAKALREGTDPTMAVDYLMGEASEIIGRGSVAGSGAFTGRGMFSRLRKGLGGEKKTLSAIEADMVRVQSVTRLVERQRVRNAIGEAIETDEIWNFGNRYRKWNEGQLTKAEMDKLLSRDGVFTTFKDGKRTIYDLKDPRAIRAMNDMTGSQGKMFARFLNSGLGRLSTLPTRMFRAGVVMGPDFMLRNVMRDVQSAGAMSKFGYTPLDTVRGFLHAIGRTKTYDDWVAGGSDAAAFTSMDLRGMDAAQGAEAGSTLALREMSAAPTFTERVKMRQAQTGDGYLRALSRMNAREAASGIKGSLGLGAKRADVEMADFPIWGVRQILYSANRVSSTLENATRLGGYAKAQRRAGQGVGYTVLQSLDRATGGLAGYTRDWAEKGWLRAGDQFIRRLQYGIADGMSRKELYKAGGDAEKVSGLRGVAARKRENLRGLIDDEFAAKFDELRNPKTAMEWLDESAEMTLDFSRKGYIGEMLNSYIAFANADFQDISRMNRAIQENPLSFFSRAWVYLTVPAMVNWIKHYDDEDYYNTLSETEKALFYHVNLDPETGQYSRIPRPAGTISAMFSRGIEIALDKVAVENPEIIGDIMKMFPWMSPEATAEFGKRSRHRDFAQEFREQATMASPLEQLNPVNWARNATVLSPWLAVEANEDPFFKSPIVPGHLSGYNAPDPQDVVNANTLEIDKMIASAYRSASDATIGRLTGKKSDLNPIQAGYIRRRYTGTVGSQIAEEVDKPFQTEDRPRVDRGHKEGNTIARGLWSNSIWGPGSAPVADFYDVYEGLQENMASFRQRQKQMDAAGAVNYINENPQLRYHEMFSNYSKTLSNMWNIRRATMSDTSIDTERRTELIYQLDQMITGTAEMAMTQYRRMEELRLNAQ